MPQDSPSACAGDTAAVTTVTEAASHADSVTNQVTAQFCSQGSSPASIATYVVELTGGGRGRLKVVAAGPNGSAAVESNDVTVNGGIDGPYPPTVLSTASNHSTRVLQVTLQGADLGSVQGVEISSLDLPQGVPLGVMSQSATELVAEAYVPVPLQPTDLRVATARGEFAQGTLPADPVAPLGGPIEAFFADADANVYPKDFALINTPTPINGQWQNLFHIYYIRHFKTGVSEAQNEVAFGHAWSRDLIHWNQNPNAFRRDTLGTWDAAHVWAPSIIRHGLSYFMFYTGVSASGDQTIGFATTAEIDTIDAPGHWARQSAPVLTAPDAAQNWVWQTHPWHMRDPFVIVDPENSFSRYLMFYCAKMASDTLHLAVGVARSDPGDLTSWNDIGMYEVTDSAHTHARRLESPHVFPDSLHHDPSQHLQATWRLMYTDGDWKDSSRVVSFVTKFAGSAVTDLASSGWSQTPTSLFDYLHLLPTSPEFGFQASEILQIGGTYYWAAYDGNGLLFRKLTWGGTPHFWLTTADLVAVGDAGARGGTRLSLAELLPGRGQARLRLELPTRQLASVVVYDVMGRAVRVLANRWFETGATELAWDGRSTGGAKLGSGMYFARLLAGEESHVVRVPFIR